MQHLTGLAPLVPRYRGWIIDLWGVVHDGVMPYPGAIDCLRRLREAEIPTVLLSNAPRRAHVAAEAMRAMGISRDLYTSVVTSGEVTHMMLRDRTDPFFAGLGARVYHLGPVRDRNVLEGLDFHVVDAPVEADFLLNTGPDDTRSPAELGEYEEELALCRQAGLPMVCANPDLEVIRGGARVICAGALARHYEAIGGVARWIGKPDPAVYRHVVGLLGQPREAVLGVGDALRTDIAGAAAAGIDACWVLGGIHGEAIGGELARAEAMAAADGLAPVATVPAFVW